MTGRPPSSGAIRHRPRVFLKTWPSFMIRRIDSTSAPRGAASNHCVRAPMAAITIGGLTTSTLLTLIVVPVVYSVVDDATLWLQTSFGRLRAAVAKRVPVEP